MPDEDKVYQAQYRYKEGQWMIYGNYLDYETAQVKLHQVFDGLSAELRVVEVTPNRERSVQRG